MRIFTTGATRDSDDNKLDFEGFLSPLVLECFAKYMHRHRQQADGQLRDSDNWQKGMSLGVYMKSKWRHFFDTWKLHRGLKIVTNGVEIGLEDSLCAELFNTMGYLHEILSKPKFEHGLSNHTISVGQEAVRKFQAQQQDGARGGYPC